MAQVNSNPAQLSETLGDVIGETATELDTRNIQHGFAETAFGNPVTDAMRQATGADIARVYGG